MISATPTENRQATGGRRKPFELKRCPSALVEEVYRTRRIPVLSGGNTDMNVFIPREQGDLLYSLVHHIRPAASLEVGMANGLSTLFIVEALKDLGEGRHTAIDPFQHSDWAGAGLALIRRGDFETLVDLVELPSHQGLPKLELEGRRFQFAFVDGSHLFDYVLTDFLCIDRMLDIGGYIAFDDSDWPAIIQVIRFAITNRHYEVAFPDIVIETARNTPTAAARIIRHVAKRLPPLAAKFRPDFITPSYELGIRGRCVVLRKTGNDDRDSQSKFHNSF